MARKRSRSATQQRFQDAVLALVGETGFAHLGVNSVSERAGSDKVLIYRYFGDFEGLLQRVAESRNWLPSVDELCSGIAPQPSRALADLSQGIARHVRIDPATHQIALWRHAVKNPLTQQFTDEWKTLWQELPRKLGHDLDYHARDKWDKTCALLALITQAELAGEAVQTSCLDALSEQLEPPAIEPASGSANDPTSELNEYTLPTNLL